MNIKVLPIFAVLIIGLGSFGACSGGTAPGNLNDDSTVADEDTISGNENPADDDTGNRKKYQQITIKATNCLTVMAISSLAAKTTSQVYRLRAVPTKIVQMTGTAAPASWVVGLVNPKTKSAAKAASSILALPMTTVVEPTFAAISLAR